MQICFNSNQICCDLGDVGNPPPTVSLSYVTFQATKINLQESSGKYCWNPDLPSLPGASFTCVAKNDLGEASASGKYGGKIRLYMYNSSSFKKICHNMIRGHLRIYFEVNSIRFILSKKIYQAWLQNDVKIEYKVVVILW